MTGHHAEQGGGAEIGGCRRHAQHLVLVDERVERCVPVHHPALDDAAGQAGIEAAIAHDPTREFVWDLGEIQWGIPGEDDLHAAPFVRRHIERETIIRERGAHAPFRLPLPLSWYFRGYL